MALEMKYFMLKPRGHNSHGRAARRAMKTYADSIKDVDCELSTDLYKWVEKENLIAIDEEFHPPKSEQGDSKNSVQQLKAEIASLADKFGQIVTINIVEQGRLQTLVNELRQLSAVE